MCPPSLSLSSSFHMAFIDSFNTTSFFFLSFFISSKPPVPPHFFCTLPPPFPIDEAPFSCRSVAFGPPFLIVFFFFETPTGAGVFLPVRIPRSSFLKKTRSLLPTVLGTSVSSLQWSHSLSGTTLFFPWNKDVFPCPYEVWPPISLHAQVFPPIFKVTHDLKVFLVCVFPYSNPPFSTGTVPFFPDTPCGRFVKVKRTKELQFSPLFPFFPICFWDPSPVSLRKRSAQWESTAGTKPSFPTFFGALPFLNPHFLAWFRFLYFFSPRVADYLCYTPPHLCPRHLALFIFLFLFLSAFPCLDFVFVFFLAVNPTTFFFFSPTRQTNLEFLFVLGRPFLFNLTFFVFFFPLPPISDSIKPPLRWKQNFLLPAKFPLGNFVYPRTVETPFIFPPCFCLFLSLDPELSGPLLKTLPKNLIITG